MPRSERTSTVNAELLRLQEQVDRLSRELDHTRRLALLGTLTGGVAHEFNNLLTPVLAYAEMAKMSPQDPALATRALDKVVVGVRRAALIAEAILSFASPARAGRQDARANIRECADAAVHCLLLNAAQDRVQVDLQIQPGLEAAIDPVLLHHVMLNLLLNARKAVQPRGGKVTIRTAAGDTSSPWNTHSQRSVVIEVEDTGCGIAPGFLPHVFEPFVTSGTTNLDSNRGHGLGLAITKQLVERAGGSIAARSTVGVGSCFVVRLPLADRMGASAVA